MACVNGRKNHRWSALCVNPEQFHLRWCKHCGSLTQFNGDVREKEIFTEFDNNDHWGKEIVTPKWFGSIPLEEYKD